MCGILPLMAAGKASPRAVGMSALGGLGGLALHHATKKKKDKPTAAQAFYGAGAGG